MQLGKVFGREAWWELRTEVEKREPRTSLDRKDRWRCVSRGKNLCRDQVGVRRGERL